MSNSMKVIDESITILLGLIGIIISLFFDTAQVPIFLICSGSFLILRTVYPLLELTRAKTVVFIFLLLDSVLLCLLTNSTYIYLIFIPLLYLHQQVIFRHSRNHILYCMAPLVLLFIQLFFEKTTSITTTINYLILELLFVFYDLFYHILIYYDTTNQRLYDLLAASAISELEQHNLNQKLAYQNTEIERAARLSEREAIGRTIHNAVGHTITSAVVTLDAGEILMDSAPQEAKLKIVQAKERMQQSLSSIRQAVRLFDQTTTKVSVADLYDILSATLEEFSTDTTCHVRHNLIVTEDTRTQYIDVKHSEFLNGAVMEALSNGIRHGNATNFIVLSKVLKSQISISILDNGCASEDSFYPNQKHLIEHGYGLKKMRNYLNDIGGELLINVKDGFELTLVIPLINSTNISYTPERRKS